MHKHVHTHTSIYILYSSLVFPFFNLKTNGKCVIAGLSFKTITNTFSTPKIKASPCPISGASESTF